jgi:hypothetical protein
MTSQKNNLLPKALTTRSPKHTLSEEKANVDEEGKERLTKHHQQHEGGN